MLFALWLRRRRRQSGDVATDESPAFALIQRCPDHCMDLADRRRGEASLQQASVEAVQIKRVELGQMARAEDGLDLSVDVALVVV